MENQNPQITNDLDSTPKDTTDRLESALDKESANNNPDHPYSPLTPLDLLNKDSSIPTANKIDSISPILKEKDPSINLDTIKKSNNPNIKNTMLQLKKEILSKKTIDNDRYNNLLDSNSKFSNLNMSQNNRNNLLISLKDQNIVVNSNSFNDGSSNINDNFFNAKYVDLKEKIQSNKGIDYNKINNNKFKNYKRSMSSKDNNYNNKYDKFDKFDKFENGKKDILISLSPGSNTYNNKTNKTRNKNKNINPNLEKLNNEIEMLNLNNNNNENYNPKIQPQNALNDLFSDFNPFTKYRINNPKFIFQDNSKFSPLKSVNNINKNNITYDKIKNSNKLKNNQGPNKDKPLNNQGKDSSVINSYFNKLNENFIINNIKKNIMNNILANPFDNKDKINNNPRKNFFGLINDNIKSSKNLLENLSSCKNGDKEKEKNKVNFSSINFDVNKEGRKRSIENYSKKERMVPKGNNVNYEIKAEEKFTRGKEYYLNELNLFNDKLLNINPVLSEKGKGKNTGGRYGRIRSMGFKKY